MRNVIIVSVLLLLSVSSSARSQMAAGSWDLQLQGSLDLDRSDSDRSHGLVTLRPGWFLTDHNEIGLTITGRLDGGKLFGDVGPFYTYNFEEREAAPFTPFLLTGLTTNLGDSDSENAVSLGAGMRFPLTEKDTFSVSAETRYSIDDTELSDTIRIQFGFSHFIGR